MVVSQLRRHRAREVTSHANKMRNLKRKIHSETGWYESPEFSYQPIPVSMSLVVQIKNEVGRTNHLDYHKIKERITGARFLHREMRKLNRAGNDGLNYTFTVVKGRKKSTPLTFSVALKMLRARRIQIKIVGGKQGV